MADAGDTALRDDVKSRLQDCRQQKARRKLDLIEGYFLAAPWRADSLDSETGTRAENRDTTDETPNTSLGMEVAGDFASHVVNTFMPRNFDWARRGPGIYTKLEEWDAIKDEVEHQDREVMKAIRASNLEAVAYQGFTPDLALGTMAVWIDEPLPAAPAVVRPVPLRELEINVGPFGDVDDRFRIRYVKPSTLPAVLPGIEIPDAALKGHKGSGPKKEKPVKVAWGFWRRWEVTGSLVWRHVITVNDHPVHDEDLTGHGSCPLIVVRFNPDASLAFGSGPMIQSLPDLRVLDALSGATQNRADVSIAPPIGYPDDGIVNFEGGIEAGMAYPHAPGSGQDYANLYFEGDPNIGFITLADLQRNVKRLHFVDEPEQLGKTPPTATQFLDELIRSQRRIGPPGQKFWAEGPAEIFMRFQWMLQNAGTIDRVEVDGTRVGLLPYNPAVASQEAQEVQNAERFVAISYGMFPQTAPFAFKDMESIKKIKEKLGDTLIELREPAEAKELAERMLAALSQQGAAQQGGGAA